MIIIFNIIHETELEKYFLKSVLCHWLWNNKLSVILDSLCKISILLSLWMLWIMLYNCLLLNLSSLNFVISWYKINKLTSKLISKCTKKLFFSIYTTAVADDTTQTNASVISIFLNTIYISCAFPSLIGIAKPPQTTSPRTS